MSETTVTNPPEGTTGRGCLSELGWLASGFVLPLVSPAFYRQAARRPARMAVLFFFVFQSIISLLLAARAGMTLASMRADITTAFEEMDMPAITISGGIASVNLPSPVILLDKDRTLLAIDTSGQITGIDQAQYTQGFLLTHDSLHVLNDRGEYQVLPLKELHKTFEKDPIFINRETVLQLWKTFATAATAASLLAIGFWQIGAWFVWVSFISVVLYGVISLFRPHTDFGAILTTGIYAFVPATYARYLLDLVNIKFISLHTLLLGLLWIFGLLFIFKLRENPVTEPARGIRHWRTLPGLPLVLGFGVNILIQWEKAAWLFWPLALVTFLALACIEFWPLLTRKEPAVLPISTAEATIDKGSDESENQGSS